jgi:hypothetical protein
MWWYRGLYSLAILFVVGTAIAIHTGFVIILCAAAAVVFAVFLADGFERRT